MKTCAALLDHFDQRNHLHLMTMPDPPIYSEFRSSSGSAENPFSDAMDTEEHPFDIYGDDEATNHEGLIPPLPPSQPGIGAPPTTTRASPSEMQVRNRPPEVSLPTPPPAAAAPAHIRHPYANGVLESTNERQLIEYHPLGMEALAIADAPPTYDKVLMEGPMCIVRPIHAFFEP